MASGRQMLANARKAQRNISDVTGRMGEPNAAKCSQMQSDRPCFLWLRPAKHQDQDIPAHRDIAKSRGRREAQWTSPMAGAQLVLCSDELRFHVVHCGLGWPLFHHSSQPPFRCQSALGPVSRPWWPGAGTFNSMVLFIPPVASSGPTLRSPSVELIFLRRACSRLMFSGDSALWAFLRVLPKAAPCSVHAIWESGTCRANV